MKTVYRIQDPKSLIEILQGSEKANSINGLLMPTVPIYRVGTEFILPVFGDRPNNFMLGVPCIQAANIFTDTPRYANCGGYPEIFQWLRRSKLKTCYDVPGDVNLFFGWWEPFELVDEVNNRNINGIFHLTEPINATHLMTYQYDTSQEVGRIVRTDDESVEFTMNVYVRESAISPSVQVLDIMTHDILIGDQTITRLAFVKEYQREYERAIDNCHGVPMDKTQLNQVGWTHDCRTSNLPAVSFDPDTMSESEDLRIEDAAETVYNFLIQNGATGLVGPCSVALGYPVKFSSPLAIEFVGQTEDDVLEPLIQLFRMNSELPMASIVLPGTMPEFISQVTNSVIETRLSLQKIYAYLIAEWIDGYTGIEAEEGQPVRIKSYPWEMDQEEESEEADDEI